MEPAWLNALFVESTADEPDRPARSDSADQSPEGEAVYEVGRVVRTGLFQPIRVRRPAVLVEVQPHVTGRLRIQGRFARQANSGVQELDLRGVEERMHLDHFSHFALTHRNSPNQVNRNGLLATVGRQNPQL